MGNCSCDEKAKVVKWLDADASNMKEYDRLRKLHDISLWAPHIPSDKEQLLPQNPSGAPKWKKYMIGVAKVAAVFTGAILIVHYLDHRGEPLPTTMQTLCVPVGQQAEITLGDGTHVWLNSKSTLTFPDRFEGKNREVELDGEAFFEVASDGGKPFVVKSAHYSVKVLGTRFNVMAYSRNGSFETLLVEGAVEITSADGASNTTLGPNEKVSLQNGKLVKGLFAEHERLLWKKGIVSFDNVTLGALLERLAPYYDVHVRVIDRQILDCRYSGKFRIDDGIGHIVKMLGVGGRFQYSFDEEHNTIIISKSKNK
ncbi:MAG: FecR domain-containing protein [Breznakibacter sp.]